jgi:hypothetical protein
MNSIAAHFHSKTPYPKFSFNPILHGLIQRCKVVLSARTHLEIHRMALLLDQILAKAQENALAPGFQKVRYTFLQRLFLAQQSYTLPSSHELADPAWAELFAVMALYLIDREGQFQHSESFDTSYFDDYFGYEQPDLPEHGRWIFINTPSLADAAILVNLAENFNAGITNLQNHVTAAASGLKRNPFKEKIVRMYWRFFVEKGYQNKAKAAEDFLSLQSEDVLRALSPTRNRESAARILNQYLTAKGVTTPRGRKKSTTKPVSALQQPIAN